MTLDVAVSTNKKDGILRVEEMLKPLPVQSNVKYIVSWQDSQGLSIPEYLETRKDVEIYRLDVKGLSNNRNNAIAHCKGDIILIADDDLEYFPDFAKTVRSEFEKNPCLDLAIFKVDFLNKKTYPAKECNLSLPFPKNYFVTSMEIAFRRERVKDLRFWPEMGLGAPKMHCGEEELFVVSAIKRKLNCQFFPTFICRHPKPTTGDNISPEILRAQGFIISIIYPFSGILRIPLKAFRLKKSRKGSFFVSTKHLFQGMVDKICRFKSIPRDYRW